MQVTRAAGYGKSGRVSNVMSNRKLRRRQHLLRLQPSNLAVIERSRSVRWRIAADQLFRGSTGTRPKESITSPKWSPESRHPSVAIGFSGTMLGRSASHGCIYEAWASALTTFATLDVRMTSSSLPSRRGPGTPRLGGPLHKPSRMLLLLIRGLTSRREHQNDPRRGMPAAVHSSAAALIWVLLAVGTGSSGQTPGQPGDVPMRVLSSAPQYVSGGDVRIEVRAASVEQPLQRRPGNGLSAVRGNRAHLGTDTSGLEDGGHVLDDDRAKCAMQVGRGIAIAAARGNAIAEDLPDVWRSVCAVSLAPRASMRRSVCSRSGAVICDSGRVPIHGDRCFSMRSIHRSKYRGPQASLLVACSSRATDANVAPAIPHLCPGITSDELRPGHLRSTYDGET